jgi:hypothetical protein
MTLVLLPLHHSHTTATALLAQRSLVSISSTHIPSSYNPSTCAMPPSMEEPPAFARSAPSLFTLPSTTTSSNYAGSQPSASRDRPASLRGERPSASPTLSAGSHASRIIRMLVGERRRAAEHEHPSAEAAEPRARGNSRCVHLLSWDYGRDTHCSPLRVSRDATASSAELGRRTRPK